jgi:hypothetical protein
MKIVTKDAMEMTKIEDDQIMERLIADKETFIED